VGATFGDLAQPETRTMLQVFLEGFLLQASLIMALGAQNLFVLESGMRRQYHLTVSFVCFLCDLTIIMLGVMGAATLFHHFPEFKIVVGIVGIIFLLQYGVGKLRQPKEDFFLSDVLKERSLRKSILRAITFSVLNPHAYLDGIVLIGGYSSKYAELPLRMGVGLGAGFCSLAWFLFLSSASGMMMPIFQDPRRMRWMMGTAGVVLIFLSLRLSMDVYGWLLEMQRPEISINPVTTVLP
jgi:L-lysine exporter family protein LysE/ArgO